MMRRIRGVGSSEGSLTHTEVRSLAFLAAALRLRRLTAAPSAAAPLARSTRDPRQRRGVSRFHPSASDPVRPDRAIAQSTGLWRPTYPPPLGTDTTRTVPVEAVAMGEVQSAQLIAFVIAIVVLLVALEIGMRRADRRR